MSNRTWFNEQLWRQAITRAPLWTIDDMDDGVDAHCANCGTPFEGTGWMCADCEQATIEVGRALGNEFWLEDREQDNDH